MVPPPLSNGGDNTLPLSASQHDPARRARGRPSMPVTAERALSGRRSRHGAPRDLAGFDGVNLARRHAQAGR